MFTVLTGHRPLYRSKKKHYGRLFTPAVTVAFVVLVVIVACCALAPLIAPYDPDVNDLYEEAVQTLRERGIPSAADLFMRIPEFDTYQIAEEIVNEEYPPYRQKYSGSKRSASSDRPKSKSPAKKKTTTRKTKGARR